MYFLFSGNELDIESKDFVEVQASDKITLVVNDKSIVITQNGIHIEGTLNINGNFDSDTIHASDIVNWSSESGNSGGNSGDNSGGATTFVIQQFASEITIDPLITENPTVIAVLSGTPGDIILISSEIGSQTIKIPESGSIGTNVRVPCIYPSGDVVYTFSVNGKCITTKTLHVTTTSDPDAPAPDAATEFTVSGIPDSVILYGASNGYSGVMQLTFTASPGSKIYTLVTWSKGSYGGNYPVVTDKHGNASTYISVILNPYETEYTCTCTCEGYADIVKTVSIDIRDLT